MKKNKPVGVLACVVFLLTVIWLGQMILLNIQLGTIDQFEKALAYATERHWFYFTFVYVNALLLTLANVLFYGSLYAMLKKYQPEWAAAAFAIVPVYGMLALGSYLSQLVLVPVLIQQLTDVQLQAFAMGALQHLLQIWPHSTIGLFDQFSYFLLGFPGLIFGLIMMKETYLRIPGILFAISGGFCFLIGVGIILNIMALVGIPSMIGGILSIAAIGMLAWKLLR